jgi:SAM-dependent methyltransferase
LIDSIFDYCHLSEGARVLEIGCGTGQATQALLDKGAIVTAVEKAPDMADFARGCLRAAPGRLSIHTQTFEEFEFEAGTYDLVLAAASLHWVLPEHRFSRPLLALKPEAHLAVLWGCPIVWNEHIKGVFASFWKEIHGPDYVLPGAYKSVDDDIRERKDEIDRSGLYEPAHAIVSEVDREETPGKFVTFLTTWSSLQFMKEPRQLEFMQETYNRLKALGQPLRSKEADLALVARAKPR